MLLFSKFRKIIPKWIFRDSKTRFLFDGSEINKYILKSYLNSFSNYLCKIYFSKILWRIGRFESISFIRNYCVYSYQTRSVFRRFKMIRHMCKKYSADGLIIGMRKSSF